MNKMYLKAKLVFPLFLFTVLCFCLAAACANTKPVLPGAGGIPSDIIPVRHLVFIGLDGWGGAYVPKANMPTVKRMMAQGSWTLEARCVMPGYSWSNWSSLFCGAPPEQRTSDAKQEMSENKAVKTIDYFPSIFTIVNSSRQAKRSTFFYEWGELQNICPDGVTEKQEITSDFESARKVAAYIIEKKPDFTAVVFNEPDSAGHNKGWGSAAYYDKLAELDSFIAVIEQAVKDAGIYDSTVFILSADHGGSFHGHGANFPKQRKIPLVVYGRGIKEGFIIPSPIGICDIAPTMAALLGMEIPPEWTGRPLLEIF